MPGLSPEESQRRSLTRTLPQGRFQLGRGCNHLNAGRRIQVFLVLFLLMALQAPGCTGPRKGLGSKELFAVSARALLKEIPTLSTEGTVPPSASAC